MKDIREWLEYEFSFWFLKITALLSLVGIIFFLIVEEWNYAIISIILLIYIRVTYQKYFWWYD